MGYICQLIEKFCQEKKYDYAVALYIMQYKFVDDRVLLDTIMQYKVDNVPNVIFVEAMSMDMFIIYTRLGMSSLEKYFEKYFNSDINFMYNEYHQLYIAPEDYARKIFVLRDEIYSFGIETTYNNREQEQINFNDTCVNADAVDEMVNMFNNTL